MDSLFFSKIKAITLLWTQTFLEKIYHTHLHCEMDILTAMNVHYQNGGVLLVFLVSNKTLPLVKTLGNPH